MDMNGISVQRGYLEAGIFFLIESIKEGAACRLFWGKKVSKELNTLVSCE